MLCERGLEEVKLCDVIDELPGMRVDEEEMLFRPYSGACSWTPPTHTPSPPGLLIEQVDAERAEKHVEQAADALGSKRALRLERNRQSAQNLRERKRLYTQRIETELEASKAQVVQLVSQVSALTAENSVLRQENDFLRGVLKGRPTAELPTTVSRPPSCPTSKRARRGGTMALTVAAVLGLAACHQSMPQIGQVHGASDGATHRTLLEHDAPATLALPDFREHYTQAFSNTAPTPVAATTGDQVTPSPSLSQALLPYVHVRKGDSRNKAALDWRALCQLGVLQLGSDRYIMLPFSELQELGWIATGPSSINTGGRVWQPRTVNTVADDVASPPSILVGSREDFGTHASIGVVGVVEDGLVGMTSTASSAAENTDNQANPKLEQTASDSRASSSSASSDHIHRVLNMLSAMTQDDRKVMLHLLTSDAEQDSEKSNSGSTSADDHEYSEWTATSPRLSSLSILLPALPQSGSTEDASDSRTAAEVVELSCGLARTWKISAD